MRLNKVADPAAVLAIPTDEDVEIIKELLKEESYAISFEYASMPANEDHPVLTKGSLLQELRAQLRDQQ